MRDAVTARIADVIHKHGESLLNAEGVDPAIAFSMACEIERALKSETAASPPTSTPQRSSMSGTAQQISLAIRQRCRQIGNLRKEVREIAQLFLPSFYSLDQQIIIGDDWVWDCEKSPIGVCVFQREELAGRLAPTTCIFCNEPTERK